MPPYSLDIIFAGPLEEWPGPKKFDLKAFITSAVNGYAAWLYEEYDIEFYSAVIRGGIHGGDRNTSESRDHITVNYKNPWLNARACHRPAHILVDVEKHQVFYNESELYGETQD